MSRPAVAAASAASMVSAVSGDGVHAVRRSADGDARDEAGRGARRHEDDGAGGRERAAGERREGAAAGSGQHADRPTLRGTLGDLLGNADGRGERRIGHRTDGVHADRAERRPVGCGRGGGPTGAQPCVVASSTANPARPRMFKRMTFVLPAGLNARGAALGTRGSDRVRVGRHTAKRTRRPESVLGGRRQATLAATGRLFVSTGFHDGRSAGMPAAV
jgi:hypothetical protein